MGGFLSNFGNAMKQMLTQPIPGTPMWSNVQNANLQKQRQSLEEQQEQRIAQQNDVVFHQKMTDVGALPVVKGMVEDQQPMHPLAAQLLGASGADSPALGQPTSPMFDEQGNPSTAASFGGDSSLTSKVLNAMGPVTASGSVPIVRKADPARTVKWKDSAGEDLAYELPSPDSQQYANVNRIKAQTQQQAEQAEAQGRQAGQLQAQQDFRQRFGMNLPPELEDQYGTPPGQKWMPGEIANFATRYNTVRRADVQQAGAMDRTQLRGQQNQQLQQVKDQAADDRLQQTNNFRDQWNKLRANTQANAQNALNGRAQLNLLDRTQREHGQLLDTGFKEGQKQLDAQAILANQEEPGLFGTKMVPATQDGEEFTDPWSGKKLTMNYAQRLRLQNGLTQSQGLVNSVNQRAREIEEQFHLSPARPAGTNGGAPSSSPASAGGPATPAAAPMQGAPSGPARAAGPAPAATAPGQAMAEALINGRDQSAAAPVSPQSKPVTSAATPGGWAAAARAETNGAPASNAPPAAGRKLIDLGLAAQYLKKAGGDRSKARKLAAADGWSF